METSARGLATVLFIWDDGYWLARGTYGSAIEEEEPVEWDSEGRQPTLRILQVSSLFFLFHYFWTI